MEVATTFRGMEKGHPVRVRGERGNFTFRYATFIDGECESVCVIGGRANHSAFRHFVPERIIVKRRILK